jgi:hypothetical protein
MEGRLEFLRFLMQLGAVLSQQRMEALWQAMVAGALTDEERDGVLSWFASIRSAPGEVREDERVLVGIRTGCDARCSC